MILPPVYLFFELDLIFNWYSFLLAVFTNNFYNLR